MGWVIHPDAQGRFVDAEGLEDIRGRAEQEGFVPRQVEVGGLIRQAPDGGLGVGVQVANFLSGAETFALRLQDAVGF